MMASLIGFVAALVRTLIKLYMTICWRFITWGVSMIALPARALSALHREKLMQSHFQEMQIELENLMWDREELEEHLKVALEERRLMDSMLTELEEEHDKAIAKIELLEDQVRRYKAENLQLKEIHGKRSFEVEYNQTSGAPTQNKVSSQELSDNRSKIALEGAVEGKTAMESRVTNRIGSRPSRLTGSLTPQNPMNSADADEDIYHRKEAAVQQSLFSALLSLAVGIIVWEAADPCMPLVVALFTVVGMSLHSVVQFFSTIRNKPASDAVALLSFNWFILGTLAYPTLPRFAQLLSPLVLRFMNIVPCWLGLDCSS